MQHEKQEKGGGEKQVKEWNKTKIKVLFPRR